MGKYERQHPKYVTYPDEIPHFLDPEDGARLVRRQDDIWIELTDQMVLEIRKQRK